MATDDLALLREYSQGKSEAAFAAIVARHIDLVYSVARRAVSDPHLAEDVTQATFIILARKAKSIGRKTLISGWLCRTARYVAANALTTKRRREFHEREASMRSLSHARDSTWLQIAPILEAAMGQ